MALRRRKAYKLFFSISMMQKIIMTIIVLAIISAGAVFYAINSHDESVVSGTDKKENTFVPGNVIAGSKENVIEITSDGFIPNSVEINAGDKVTWISKIESESWPASAMHPTHTVYPWADYDSEGSFSGSKACVSEGVAKKGAFDSCSGLKKGESWSFIFEQKGAWNYHDHLQAGKYGKVIVN